MMKTCTVIVVSHVDLRTHQNANELVNIKDHKIWQRPHHECKFLIKGQESVCTQMQKAVRQHAKKYWEYYGLHEEASLEVIPFTTSWYFHRFIRPSFNKDWEPRSREPNFIYVHPSVKVLQSQSLDPTPSCNLLFIKLLDSLRNTLRFCGTVSFVEDELIATKIPYIRKLCNVTGFSRIYIHSITANDRYDMVETSKTFKEQTLQTGSILIVSKDPIDKSVDPKHKDLRFPPYGQHSYCACALLDDANIMLGAALYEQAKEGKYTDLTLLSAKREGEEQLRLAVHKNVLTTIPYFKALFEIGMKETNSEPPVCEVEAPSWATNYAIHAFHEYIYLRDISVITERPSFSIEGLCELIRLADFYCCQELLENIAAQMPQQYSHLNVENTLELLTILQSLEFPRRNELESLLLKFVESHFSLIGRSQQFGEMQGSDVYNLIIDTMAKVGKDTW
jgi:hypothetical protein